MTSVVWDKDERRVDYHKHIWRETFELAKEYDIDFSMNTRLWTYDQIKSFVGWEEREFMGYKGKYTLEEINNIIERNSKFYSISV
jgi:hypothetical protein